ncbi:Electron transfer flavoprotein alpha/beta- subunit [Cellulomonas flavigena DSM 20109]|uniref:Electron transfer flavoprotein subunit beta n=1 Tax=Cellulomonas flavigena (strain ATCC 482 / DSM 20109 / BCRC 11376 / JCM 18109 / NBRC 3775 / NCIMB 8073 / NRS 134) TaxID=446466 RepID=D5UE72_CELFN|nr:electron transfer flavoprotein subunit beta/FixA family protein [Cellulomonas flavigena]ADG76548.1 Electron transfer flavoprotein alpha/beta- subunit [Cellulomonas flavigena DSM 20109]
MRIVVCVKHVPDVQADRQFGADGHVDRTQDDGTLNELDEYALEAALVVAEEVGGQVVVLTMGPPAAEGAVRRGLQIGATQGVHVVDDALAGSDAFATAHVLAAAIRKIGQDAPVDLVVTGMASLDSLTSVVPTLLAAELHIAELTLAAKVTVAHGLVRIERELDDAREVLEAPLPAVVSVTDRANEPRYPSFKGIAAARRTPVTHWTIADLAIEPSRVGSAAARTRVVDAVARPKRENRVLITDSGDAGIRLAAYLVDNNLA